MRLHHNNGDIVVSVVPYLKGQIYTVLENYTTESGQAQRCCKLLNLRTNEVVIHPEHWFQTYKYDLYIRMIRGESV